MRNELQRGMAVVKLFKTGVSFKQFAPALVLVFNSIAWFSIVSIVLGNSIDRLSLAVMPTFALYGCYYVGSALSALLGAWLFPRAREKYLLFWILLGTLASALLPTVGSNDLSVNMLFSAFLGVSVGLGLPSSLAYFADTAIVENRGRCGGVVWGAVGSSILFMGLLVNTLGVSQAFIALSIWRGAGLITFYVLSRFRGKTQSPTRAISYRVILGRRDVVLYLVPWIMFSLINFAESPILDALFGIDLHAFLGLIELAITGFFAIVGGVLADLVGRKRVVITGFVVLGVEYATLSLFSATQASWYVYTVLDGIAWGMFAAVFFMTLWGDLAEEEQKEKYYVLGGLPFLLAGFLPVLVKPLVGGIETVTAFSLASFFLFLAVLPLMYAPETLPEKKIKEMELRSYAEKAKKIKEKYA